MLQSKVLLRIIRIYTVFFALIFLIAMPLYIRAISLFSQKQLAVHEALLNSGVDRLDSQLSQLSRQVQSLSLDSRFHTVSTAGFTYRSKEVLAMLEVQNSFIRNMSAYDLVYDCGIVYDNGYILTRERSFYANSTYWDSFYGRYLSVEQWEHFNDWQVELQTIDSPTMLPSRKVNSIDFGTYDAIIWIVPVYSGNIYGYSRHGFFYAMLPVSRVLAALAADDIISNSSVQISSGGVTLVDSAAAVSSGRFHTLSDSGYASGISVKIGIPDSLFSGQLSPMLSLVALYVVLSLSIGAVLTPFFAYRSYKPIQKLAKEAKRLSRLQDSEDAPVSEFDLIGKSIDHMGKTLAEFWDRLKVQIDINREILLNKMIHGNVIFASEIDEFMRLIPDFPGTYRIALLRFIGEGDQSIEAAAAYQLVLEDLAAQYLDDGYYMRMLEEKQPVIMLLIPETDGGQGSVKKVENMAAWLENKFQTHFQIALSDPFAGPMRISAAYTQAVNILRFCKPDLDGLVNTVESIPKGRALPVPEFSQIKQMYEALLNGECKVVELVLDLVRQTAARDTLTLRHVHTSLAFAFSGVREELFDILAEIELPVLEPDMDINALIDAFSSCAKAICSLIAAKKQPLLKDLTHNILSYIKDNLTSNNLYTKTLVEEFDISETTLQKLMRIATGKSFFEYVEDLRLSMVSQLILTTDKPLSAVAAECGFSSYNSMYKAFQRKYGVSPGSLRKT